MVFPLQSTVQHYAWGGFRFLPDLLHLPVPQTEPFAELWMGAHPGAPSTVVMEQQSKLLTEAIAENPTFWLGQKILGKFGPELPFLFKILDVRRMLSIQAHPTKARAEEGFQRENALGIPLQAANRVYKDANHKPEVMVALSEFWLLHGFRHPDDILNTLTQTRELNSLATRLKSDKIAGLYRYLMELPQEEVNALLLPLRQRVLPLLDAGTLEKSSPDYWAAQAFLDYELPGGHCDRGIFSIYLLNLVQLHPGQGIFQDAGIPHAYLEGQNVELMANSDNVFRGGLTPKYIAVRELIDNLVFEPVTPHVLEGVARNAQETVFPTPAPDFELAVIHLQNGETYELAAGQGPEVLFLMEGRIQIDADRMYERGASALVLPESLCTIKAQSPAILYKASVGALND